MKTKQNKSISGITMSHRTNISKQLGFITFYVVWKDCVKRALAFQILAVPSLYCVTSVVCVTTLNFGFLFCMKENHDT
jgi:hypothetical protein